MPKITGSIEKDALDVKKLFLKGLILEDECPLCKSKVENDFGEDRGYLCYPTPGSPEPVFLYCEDCDHEWEVKVVLDITLKLHGETK